MDKFPTSSEVKKASAVDQEYGHNKSSFDKDKEAVLTPTTAASPAPASINSEEHQKRGRKRDQSESSDEDDNKMPSRPLSAYNLFFRDERHNWVKNKEARKHQGAQTDHGHGYCTEMENA